MKICNNCNSHNIKSHRNFPYGKKSKPKTRFTCRNCGSTDIKVTSNNQFGRKRRR